MRTPSVLSIPVIGNIAAGPSTDSTSSLQAGSGSRGWPSPAEEELIDTLSFDEWLVQDSCIMVRVSHDAMQDAGIHNGDIAVVKRGKKPADGDIVIADADNEWIMRYYHIERKKPILYPANGLYPIIKPQALTIIGVVIAIIRKYY